MLKIWSRVKHLQTFQQDFYIARSVCKTLTEGTEPKAITPWWSIDKASNTMGSVFLNTLNERCTRQGGGHGQHRK